MSPAATSCATEPPVTLAVGVGLGVGVAVGEVDAVAVAVGEPPPVPLVTMTSWGGFVPSLELKSTPLVDCATKPKQVGPLPEMNGVTSNSSQTPAVMAPLSSRGFERAGLLDQVIDVSPNSI